MAVGPTDGTPMPPDRARELAALEALIATAEAELAALRQGQVRGDVAASDPADLADPVTCLGIWLAVLRRRCDELRRPRGGARRRGRGR